MRRRDLLASVLFQNQSTPAPVVPGSTLVHEHATVDFAGVVSTAKYDRAEVFRIAKPKLEELKKNIDLLVKVRKSLKPGGRAAILEFVPNEDRVSPPMATAFSIIMLASTAAGDACTLREYTEMCRAAGNARATAHPVPVSPHTVVMAHTS